MLQNVKKGKIQKVGLFLEEIYYLIVAVFMDFHTFSFNTCICFDYDVIFFSKV